MQKRHVVDENDPRDSSQEKSTQCRCPAAIGPSRAAAGRRKQRKAPTANSNAPAASPSLSCCRSLTQSREVSGGQRKRIQPIWAWKKSLADVVRVLIVIGVLVVAAMIRRPA